MSESRKNLLIVDDEAMTRQLMSQIFGDLGYGVRTAENGFAALAEIRQGVPDVILSDLNMPGMTGFELLSVVRRRFPGIRVIAMSGAFSGDAVQPGVAADAFYEKASRLPTLLEIVEVLSKPEQAMVKHPRKVAPIRIPTDGHDRSGESCVTIACPECLRMFPQVLGEEVYFIRETACTSCGSLIHFAIILPTDAASPQAFQQKILVGARA